MNRIALPILALMGLIASAGFGAGRAQTPIPPAAASPAARSKSKLTPLKTLRVKSDRPAPKSVMGPRSAMGPAARREACGGDEPSVKSPKHPEAGAGVAAAPDLIPGTKGTGVVSINYNETRDAQLNDSDPLDGQFYTDRFGFYGYAGDAVRIKMNSNEVNPFLCLFAPNSQICNDNGGGGTDALLEVVLPETGSYEIWASSYDPYDTGHYNLYFNVFNDATFVAIDAPETLQPNESYYLQAQVRNLGDGTWTEDMRYRLGTTADNPFGPTRFQLANSDAVGPNGDFIFAGWIQAPAQPGSYTFTLQMLQEFVEYFGDTLPITIQVGAIATPSPTPSPSPTPAQADNASFAALDMPYLAAPGETFPYSVTVVNTGSNTWTSGGGYGLATTYDGCDSFPTLISLPVGAAVPPGGEYTFTGTATGPANTTLFEDRLESPNSGWTTDGLWHHTTPSTSGYALAHGGSGAWWYGSETTGYYDVPAGQRNTGALVSPQFAIPSGETAFVDFYSLESTEHVNGVDTRRLYVDDGTNLTLIHDSFLDTERWEHVGPFDISDFAGKTIRLRFEFDTVDGQNNQFWGWYLDDVRVMTSPCYADFRMIHGSAFFGPTLQTGLTIDDEYQTDFSYAGGDANGWYGGIVSGSGQTSLAEFGLCMQVPASGDNLLGWISPERYIELKDMTVYRARMELHTDQTAADAIPLWDFFYDNYNSNGYGNNYGGEGWFLDVANGANGLDRAQGRSEMEMYLAPNALLTPQWRGLLSDGTAGAFSAAADDINDMRFGFRLLDIGSAGVNANIDSGTVCVRGLLIESIPYSELALDEVLWNAPITSAYYEPHTYDQTPDYAVIDDANARALYSLDTTSDRATLLPAIKPLPYATAQLYPVLWRSNTLYRTTAVIQLAESSTGVDPPDAVFILNDVATSEIGQSHVSLRGSAGGPMFRAASPRKASLAGGAQLYVGFLYGENQTLIGLPNQDRLRPMVDLFNRPDLYGTGTGADLLEVLSLDVSSIQAR